MVKTLTVELLNIKEVKEQFIFHCQYEKNLDNKSISAYKVDLRQFELFVVKKTTEAKLTEVSKEILKEYIQSLSHFKPKTIKRKLASLKAMFNFIEFEYDDFVNPFRKIKVKIKEPFILPTVMSIKEIEILLKLLYKEYEHSQELSDYRKKTCVRNIAIFELLFITGIRVSELCNLRCSDIDFHNGSIKVFGKGNKERVIQICQKDVLDILNLYYAFFNPSSYFFINRLGKQISPQSIRLLVKKYVSLSGIDKNITPHTFRHTFATLLLEEDVDIKYIQNLLGHSSISTTQIYTHVSSHKQKDILSTKHPRLKVEI